MKISFGKFSGWTFGEFAARPDFAQYGAWLIKCAIANCGQSPNGLSPNGYRLAWFLVMLMAQGEWTYDDGSYTVHYTTPASGSYAVAAALHAVAPAPPLPAPIGPPGKGTPKPLLLLLHMGPMGLFMPPMASRFGMGLL